MPISPHLRLGTEDAANLLVGVVQANLAQIIKSGGRRGKFPILEGIQNGTVRYKRLDRREHWQTWNELMEQLETRGLARGDCEDLASAVAAELINAGIDARVYVYQSGPRLYHVVVSTKRWGFLDPSRAAGMDGNG